MVSAEAGPQRKGTKSDIWIQLEITTSGGVRIDLESNVQVMYGEAIEGQLRGGLATLGIENANLKARDGGALPFAIAARLETAVRRALGELDQELLPASRVQLKAGERDRFRRSRLYLPGNLPKLFPNAPLHGADAYILDLEDAVAPPEKDAARVMVRNALRTIDFGEAETMVRINQGEAGLADLPFIVPHPVQLILIPKVESPEEVNRVDTRIREIMDKCGRRIPIYLMPIIESCRGALQALAIAESSPRVVALAIGLEDYTADLGVERTNKGDESFWMRGQVVNSCRAAGIQAIDTVFSDVADRAGLQASVQQARGLGFDGKGCIHPRQINPIHEAFAPGEQEIARACEIVIAFEKAEAEGLGVVSLGSKMIDPPVVKRALRTVTLAQTMNLLPATWKKDAAK